MTGRTETKSLPNVPPATVARGQYGRRLNVVEKTLWLLLALVLLKTWCVEGLFCPLVVSSGSMAPTLLGTHRKVVCRDCGFPFNRGIESRELAERAVCPNCGYAGNDILDLADVSGDRLLMHKSAFFFRRPRIWEVVAFRDPARADRIVVKRVVGLPGEAIEIRHGDVYADGKIRRKPLWLQRAMAVLVHDAAYSTNRCDSPNTNWVTDRWAADGPDAQWGFADGKFAHPQDIPNGKTQWLTYCHGRHVELTAGVSTAGGGCSTFVPSPVTDLCGYNQTRPRRDEDLHTVDDLMLSLRVMKLWGQGSLSIRARHGRGEFLVRFDVQPPHQNRNGEIPAARFPSGTRCASIRIWRDGRHLNDLKRQVFALPDGSNSNGFGLEVSLFDRRLLVAVDGRTIVDCPYEYSTASDDCISNPHPDCIAASSPLRNCGTGILPVEETPHAQIRLYQQSASRPLAIGRDGLGLILENLRVYRDVYYTDPPKGVGSGTNTVQTQLAAHEYYVLGDNSPISSDSRNWRGGAAVSAKLLVGKPLVVLLPSRGMVLAGREFQVPDIGRIRYIR